MKKSSVQNSLEFMIFRKNMYVHTCLKNIYQIVNNSGYILSVGRGINDQVFKVLSVFIIYLNLY